MGKEPNHITTGKVGTRNAEGTAIRRRGENIITIQYNTDGGQWDALDKKDIEGLSYEISDILKNAGIDKKGFIILEDDNIYITVDRNISIQRSFDKRTGTMSHEFFEIENHDLRGKGISKKIHKALIPLYEKLGVKEIQVYAALDNGAYTWAQYGFRVDKPEALRYVSNLKRKGEEATKIVNDYYETHKPTDRFPMKMISSQPWARDAMAWTDYYGFLDFRNPEEKKDFYSYVGYKKR